MLLLLLSFYELANGELNRYWKINTWKGQWYKLMVYNRCSIFLTLLLPFHVVYWGVFVDNVASAIHQILGISLYVVWIKQSSKQYIEITAVMFHYLYIVWTPNGVKTEKHKLRYGGSYFCIFLYMYYRVSWVRLSRVQLLPLTDFFKFKLLRVNWEVKAGLRGLQCGKCTYLNK